MERKSELQNIRIKETADKDKIGDTNVLRPL